MVVERSLRYVRCIADVLHGHIAQATLGDQLECCVSQGLTRSELLAFTPSVHASNIAGGFRPCNVSLCATLAEGLGPRSMRGQWANASFMEPKRRLDRASSGLSRGLKKAK